MTDTPETIWAVHGNTEGAVVNGAWADTIRYFCGGIEYRRADLVAPATPPMPLTTAQIMADPRVKALVEATDGCRMFLAENEPHPLPILGALLNALAQLKEQKP
jgi:hypothetical protein